MGDAIGSKTTVPWFEGTSNNVATKMKHSHKQYLIKSALVTYLYIHLYLSLCGQNQILKVV